MYVLEQMMKIVEVSKWWTSYVFVDFNKNMHTGSQPCLAMAILNAELFRW